ncbi:NIPSNAP family protein (plasmid) [Deinococcus sp. KNUC1210]|uniref:NIPSNAP family protein n=1 Tax=Deinococcus sp. KNUC1210 TaxID=2917691 RepID=UPI001EF06390|nr:NIPSNAP family protein [Deinococcus sp. KNUC1210]ULH13951.1 NIPSNAP family protein [Deinococcus sp. KNUC1210]
MSSITSSSRTVEIRSYTLVAGLEGEFARIFNAEAAPMLARWQVDVVAFGLSLEPRGAYLIRAYDSLAHRQHSQDEFYGSAEWRNGPRTAILACIEQFSDVVLPLDPAAVQALRTSLAASSDLT